MLVDKSIIGRMGSFRPTGVAPELVFMAREALDREGYGHVKIIVSGGFNAERISRFEAQKVPVDAYGVGSSLMQGSNDFTADIVRVGGKNLAKAGRVYKTNTRMEAVQA